MGRKFSVLFLEEKYCWILVSFLYCCKLLLGSEKCAVRKYSFSPCASPTKAIRTFPRRTPLGNVRIAESFFILGRDVIARSIF